MTTTKNLVESMIVGWLNESSDTVVSRLKDMVNKKTESRVLRIGGKMQSVSLAQASYLVQMYDNQDDKDDFEAALNDKKEFESIMKTVSKYVKESYAVSYKGQPFAHFDTEPEAKKHLEKYAKKGDASSYKVVKESAIDLDESFSDAQIAALKAEYGKINKIDPDSPSYKKLTKMLDSIPDDMLKKLSNADIKFVSALAKNRVAKRGLNEIFVTVIKNGTRGYLPKWKKRSGDDWKSFDIAHFPSENEARDWVKKDHSDAMFVKEDADLNESDYKIMHKSFTDAVSAAKEKAEKAGYTIDDEEWFNRVSTGPKKPGTDKTNRYSIPLDKNGKRSKMHLNFQVYNTGGAYELNAYIN
jgi:hypothetical protein